MTGLLDLDRQICRPLAVANGSCIADDYREKLCACILALFFPNPPWLERAMARPSPAFATGTCLPGSAMQPFSRPTINCTSMNSDHMPRPQRSDSTITLDHNWEANSGSLEYVVVIQFMFHLD
jgi:hypothetical protein